MDLHFYIQGPQYRSLQAVILKQPLFITSQYRPIIIVVVLIVITVIFGSRGSTSLLKVNNKLFHTTTLFPSYLTFLNTHMLYFNKLHVRTTV